MEGSSACMCDPSTSASVCDSSSPQASFADRFQDIPDALRDVMIGACVQVMARAVREVADAMRRLSLDDGVRRCLVCIKQMAREIRAAQMMGFAVDDMAERLVRLRAISSEYGRAVERMERRRAAIRRLREELQALEAEHEKDYDLQCDCRSEFRNVAEAPWEEITD